MSLMRWLEAILALAKFEAEALASPMAMALFKIVAITLWIEDRCQRSLSQQGVDGTSKCPDLFVLFW